MSHIISFAQQLAARRRYVARTPGGGGRVGPSADAAAAAAGSACGSGCCSGANAGAGGSDFAKAAAAGSRACMDGLMRNRFCDSPLGFQHAAAFVGHKNISKGSQHR